jgi:pimeloyl-ACP methyl ester carboxylesterase
LLRPVCDTEDGPVGIPETRFARTEDGLDIAYQVFGAGPDLVFVRRFTGTIGYMWDVPPFARFLERLGEVCRVFALDPRGVGLSDRVLPPNVFALEDRVFDLLAVMDAEAIEHASLLGVEDGARSVRYSPRTTHSGWTG